MNTKTSTPKGKAKAKAKADVSKFDWGLSTVPRVGNDDSDDDAGESLGEDDSEEEADDDDESADETDDGDASGTTANAPSTPANKGMPTKLTFISKTTAGVIPHPCTVDKDLLGDLLEEDEPFDYREHNLNYFVVMVQRTPKVAERCRAMISPSGTVCVLNDAKSDREAIETFAPGFVYTEAARRESLALNRGGVVKLKELDVFQRFPPSWTVDRRDRTPPMRIPVIFSSALCKVLRPDKKATTSAAVVQKDAVVLPPVVDPAAITTPLSELERQLAIRLEASVPDLVRKALASLCASPPAKKRKTKNATADC
jgi:hypothetical protein